MSTQKDVNNWELLNNPLKERIKRLMTNEELAKPYSFATRVGLSKGTFTGIWSDGRKSLHQSTIEKICAATGANAGWLATGSGEPFPQATEINDQPRPNTNNTPTPVQTKTIQKQGLTLSTSINIDKLKEVFETTEEILRTQNRTMPAEARGEFTIMLYKMFTADGDANDAQNFNAQLLQNVTHAVENLLEHKQLKMSPKNKTLLIIAIYTLYIDVPADINLLTETSEILLRKIA